MLRTYGVLAGACLGLAGCGGDEGGGGGPPSPPPVSTLSVTLSSSSQAVTAMEDASEATIGFTATQSGTTSDPVYPDVQYDRDVMTLQGSLTTAAPGNYSATFKTKNDLAGGEHRGTVTFRLCRDTGCTSVYPGSSQSFSYTLTVQLKDWVALQRNPAHTGFVRARFDPANFKKAWEWAPSNVTEMSSVATKGNTIFVSRRNQDGTSSVHSLNGASGSEQWGHNFGRVHSFIGP